MNNIEMFHILTVVFTIIIISFLVCRNIALYLDLRHISLDLSDMCRSNDDMENELHFQRNKADKLEDTNKEYFSMIFNLKETIKMMGCPCPHNQLKENYETDTRCHFAKEASDLANNHNNSTNVVEL